MHTVCATICVSYAWLESIGIFCVNLWLIFENVSFRCFYIWPNKWKRQEVGRWQRQSLKHGKTTLHRQAYMVHAVHLMMILISNGNTSYEEAQSEQKRKRNTHKKPKQYNSQHCSTVLHIHFNGGDRIEHNNNNNKHTRKNGKTFCLYHLQCLCLA